MKDKHPWCHFSACFI